MSASRLPTRRCDGVTPSILGAFGRVEFVEKSNDSAGLFAGHGQRALGSLLLDRGKYWRV